MRGVSDIGYDLVGVTTDEKFRLSVFEMRAVRDVLDRLGVISWEVPVGTHRIDDGKVAGWKLALTHGEVLTKTEALILVAGVTSQLDLTAEFDDIVFNPTPEELWAMSKAVAMHVEEGAIHPTAFDREVEQLIADLAAQGTPAKSDPGWDGSLPSGEQIIDLLVKFLGYCVKIIKYDEGFYVR